MYLIISLEWFFFKLIIPFVLYFLNELLNEHSSKKNVTIRCASYLAIDYI